MGGLIKNEVFSSKQVDSFAFFSTPDPQFISFSHEFTHINMSCEILNILIPNELIEDAEDTLSPQIEKTERSKNINFQSPFTVSNCKWQHHVTYICNSIFYRTKNNLFIYYKN